MLHERLNISLVVFWWLRGHTIVEPWSTHGEADAVLQKGIVLANS